MSSIFFSINPIDPICFFGRAKVSCSGKNKIEFENSKIHQIPKFQQFGGKIFVPIFCQNIFCVYKHIKCTICFGFREEKRTVTDFFNYFW